MSDAPLVRVLGGSPTDEETAAIAALFTQLLHERDVARLPLPAEARRSAWARRARPLRSAWTPGSAWGDMDPASG